MSIVTTNRGSVFFLKYHIVWCTKYRRPVLTNKIADRFREVALEKATAIGASIPAMEVMLDHIHLFVEATPVIGVAAMVGHLKGCTARVLRQEFSALKRRMPVLWSRSYYIGSAGQVSEAVIKRYIANQKGT